VSIDTEQAKREEARAMIARAVVWRMNVGRPRETAIQAVAGDAGMTRD